MHSCIHRGQKRTVRRCVCVVRRVCVVVVCVGGRPVCVTGPSSDLLLTGHAKHAQTSWLRSGSDGWKERAWLPCCDQGCHRCHRPSATARLGYARPASTDISAAAPETV